MTPREFALSQAVELVSRVLKGGTEKEVVFTAQAFLEFLQTQHHVKCPHCGQYFAEELSGK
jgi:hypothetical protein